MNATLLLLAQLVLILSLSRLCGAALPGLHATLFSAASLPVLSGLATIGVTLFMFIVGLELRAPEGGRSQLRAASCIGLLGLALPLPCRSLPFPFLRASSRTGA